MESLLGEVCRVGPWISHLEWISEKQSPGRDSGPGGLPQRGSRRAAGEAGRGGEG